MGRNEPNEAIHNLSSNDYAEGADLSMENAENLLEIARLSIEKGYSGNGAAILITSLEELAKAALLKMKAHEPKLHVRDLEKMFKHHPTKHQFGALLFTKTITENINNLPEDKQNGAAIAVVIIAGFIMYFVATTDLTLELEVHRKRGFYVDFDPVNESWITPKQVVSIKNIKAYIQIVEGVFKNVKKDLFMDQLTSRHLKAYIDELGVENVHFKKNFNFPKDHSDQSNPV